MRRLVVCCMAFLLCGCGSSQETSIETKGDYLSALSTLELDPRAYDSYQTYYSSVTGRMGSWLSQLEQPEELRGLFYACHSIASARQGRWQWLPLYDRMVTQRRLQWIDPHFDSRELILYRLAEIKTPAAAEVLVDLYCDREVGYDAGFSLTADDAVVQCGRLALPFLKAKQGGPHRDVSRVMALVESGATTGF